MCVCRASELEAMEERKGELTCVGEIDNSHTNTLETLCWVLYSTYLRYAFQTRPYFSISITDDREDTAGEESIHVIQRHS